MDADARRCQLDADERFQCRCGRSNYNHITTATLMIGTFELVLTSLYVILILYCILSDNVNAAPRTVLGFAFWDQESLRNYSGNPFMQQQQLTRQLYWCASLLLLSTIETVFIVMLFIGIYFKNRTLLMPFLIMLVFEQLMWTLSMIVWLATSSVPKAVLEIAAGFTHWFAKMYFLWIVGRCYQYLSLKQRLYAQYTPGTKLESESAPHDLWLHAPYAVCHVKVYRSQTL